MSPSAKELVPASWIPVVRGALVKAKVVALRSIAWSSRLTTLYYAVDSSFHREQRAVTHGILRHHMDRNGESAVFRLRRNTHRLEKALLMRPRRDLFAVDYIEETVARYASCRASELAPRYAEDLRWSFDVLSEYFRVTRDHPTVVAARTRFRALPGPDGPVDRSPPRIPRLRPLGESPVSYEALYAGTEKALDSVVSCGPRRTHPDRSGPACGNGGPE